MTSQADLVRPTRAALDELPQANRKNVSLGIRKRLDRRLGCGVNVDQPVERALLRDFMARPAASAIFSSVSIAIIKTLSASAETITQTAPNSEAHAPKESEAICATDGVVAGSAQSGAC